MTKDERLWIDAIAQMGCCVCLRLGWGPTSGEVHHLLNGGQRIGHLYSIPLCMPGHHRGGDGKNKISRHPWKVRFEIAYGTEAELLKWTQEYVAMQARRAA